MWRSANATPSQMHRSFESSCGSASWWFPQPKFKQSHFLCCPALISMRLKKNILVSLSNFWREEDVHDIIPKWLWQVHQTWQGLLQGRRVNLIGLELVTSQVVSKYRPRSESCFLQSGFLSTKASMVTLPKCWAQISSDLKMIQESPSKTCLLCSCNAGQGGSHLKTNCHKEGPTRQTLNHPTAIQLMFGDLWEWYWLMESFKHLIFLPTPQTKKKVPTSIFLPFSLRNAFF